jgi:hypothetical protein
VDGDGETDGGVSESQGNGDMVVDKAPPPPAKDGDGETDGGVSESQSNGDVVVDKVPPPPAKDGDAASISAT